MTKRLLINDSWILERAGYFSSSFSGFISNITGGVKLSESIQKGLAIASKLTTREGQKELGIPAFVGPLVSKISSSLGEDFSTMIQEEIQRSMKQADMEVQKALKESDQKREKALKKLEQIQKTKLSKLDERLAQLDQELDQMGDTIGQRVASNLFGTNLDSLAKALYEVAKERGVTNEGVLNLIRMLPEFEALMYFMNVRKFYRDHTAHSLRVAVLGDFILDKKGGSGDLEGLIQDKLEFNKEEARTTWWLAGLLHDIGTPLAKLVTSINWSLVNEMLRCYPSIGMEISPLRIDISNPTLGNEDYLKILYKGMPKSWQKLVKSGLGIAKIPDEVFVYTADEEKSTEYHSKSPKMDHGVVAAVTLLRTLGPPERVEKELAEDRPLIEAARAIALHNMIPDLRKIPFEDYPVLFILAVADEIQEWGRPIPVTMQEGFFTTTLEKITLLNAIFHESASELWDIPYVNTQAKKLARFDFKRLYNDKAKALRSLDCSEQFPESDLWLIDFDEEKSEASNKYGIKIITQ